MWVIGGWSDLCQLSGDCGGWVCGGWWWRVCGAFSSVEITPNTRKFLLENILHRNKQSNNSIYFH